MDVRFLMLWGMKESGRKGRSERFVACSDLLLEAYTYSASFSNQFYLVEDCFHWAGLN